MNYAFDKDMQKLYIHKNRIFSYQLCYFLSYVFETVTLNFSRTVLVIQAILCGLLLYSHDCIETAGWREIGGSSAKEDDPGDPRRYAYQVCR